MCQVMLYINHVYNFLLSGFHDFDKEWFEEIVTPVNH